MSSIPTFPWIPSSESILRYRPITGEMELVTRLRTMEAKAFSFTHRTKVFADGTVRKNSA
jgi:hypothetical protein